MACSGCGLHAACHVQRLCLAITLHAALAHVVQQQQCAVGTLQGALAAGELTLCFKMISVVCSYVYAVIECAFVVLTALRNDVRKTVRTPFAYWIRCRITFVNTFANTFVNYGMRSCLRRVCEFARWCSVVLCKVFFPANAVYWQVVNKKGPPQKRFHGHGVLRTLARKAVSLSRQPEPEPRANTQLSCRH